MILIYIDIYEANTPKLKATIRLFFTPSLNAIEKICKIYKKNDIKWIVNIYFLTFVIENNTYLPLRLVPCGCLQSISNNLMYYLGIFLWNTLYPRHIVWKNILTLHTMCASMRVRISWLSTVMCVSDIYIKKRRTNSVTNSPKPFSRHTLYSHFRAFKTTCFSYSKI